MTGVMGIGDGRVWVEQTPAGKVSLQVNEMDRGNVRAAEVLLEPDEVIDLAVQLLASVRPVDRFAAGQTAVAG